jgi:glycosyltransferase involved in cell wall biosynthesis
MRILFAHNNADLYGSSRSLLRLASRLVKDGSDVYVVLPFEGALNGELREAGIQVMVLPGMAVIERAAFRSLAGLLSFSVRLPVSIWRMMRLIRRLRPDLVHSNTSVMLPSAIAARMSRVRHIWHIREFYTEFPGFWKAYQRIMGACSDSIVCVSKAVQEQFSSSVRKTTTVIHNGFPLEEFEPVGQERINRFKAAFGLENRRLVGLVGRIILQRKGHEIFVQAAALLKDRFPDVRFLVVGACYPGNEFHGENLNQLIDELGVDDFVVQTGEVEDIKSAYAALDVSVLASAKPEPFGGVVIESMALGKPVVGTNIGGTPEQLQDGVTGLLVPPGNAEAMADALARLLEDESLCQRMGVSARKRFEREFGFEPFYLKMMRVYNKEGNQ